MQTVLRWNTNEPSQASTAWKAAFSATHQDAPWQHLAVVQSNTALSLVAKHPDASRWLTDNIGTLSRVVMGFLNRVITMEHLELQPNIRVQAQMFWAYDLPKVVVAKSGQDWSGLNEGKLSEEKRAKLASRFAVQLQEQLALFGLSADGDPPLQIEIVDDGVPMPIKESLPTSKAGSAGRAEQSLLARKGMKLRTIHRIEGDFSVGQLVGLGYGRVFRDGYSANSDVA